MDNATYDELVSVTPVSNDETYSRLRMTQTKVRPSNDLTRRADIDQNTTKGVKQTSTKEASSNTKVLIALLITMIVILLLLMLVSIALSVATVSRLTSLQSQLASQLDNSNDDTRSEVNLTQLIQIQNNISQTLAQLDDRVNETPLNPQSQPKCGAGLWWRVAYLDMTEPLQQCPSAWREYNTSGVRACGRPVNSTGSCAAVFYFTKRQYSSVCGRIIGYQVASPDAFEQSNGNFNGRGLDGVIISHGAQQDHVWSFVAGYNEENHRNRCPCSTGAGTQTPTTIGDNYFCESGNPNNAFDRGRLYSSDRLWDGEQCEGRCCEGAQSPPWFSVQLPAPTTDMIEVSICCDQGTLDEDTPVEQMEIYVQ
jgi:cell division protein FtsL